MWRQYFGEGCHVYGVDIEPACRKYESDDVTIHIGDQADRRFWRSLDLPPIDIVIDDGGHLANQMIVTFEELLPRMTEEGVYLVEDIHGPGHAFLGYLYGLIRQLNAAAFRPTEEPSIASSSLQRRVNGIHVYPFVTAIELSPAPDVFHCTKRGTEWQPF